MAHQVLDRSGGMLFDPQRSRSVPWRVHTVFRNLSPRARDRAPQTMDYSRPIVTERVTKSLRKTAHVR